MDVGVQTRDLSYFCFSLFFSQCGYLSAPRSKKDGQGISPIHIQPKDNT